MNLDRRYALKRIIDKALEPYGASAVSWVTGFSQLRIRKYDYPYSADRSPIFEEYIQDEQDWLARKAQIIAELAKLVAIAETAQYVSDGLLSSEEADRLYHGRMV
jgi:hypothetical protein